jgi:hypothetical protein
VKHCVLTSVDRMTWKMVGLRSGRKRSGQ